MNERCGGCEAHTTITTCDKCSLLTCRKCAFIVNEGETISVMHRMCVPKKYMKKRGFVQDVVSTN